MIEFGDQFLSRQRLLVISPHADDESYSCAGTMARIKSLGGEVYVVLASVGNLHHYGTTGGSARKLVTENTRLAEFDAVMKHLKVDDWDVLPLGGEAHMALDTLPRKRLVGLLEQGSRLALDTLRPTMVMIPANSYNQDHSALFEACVTATRPGAPGQKYTVPWVLSCDHTSLFWTGDRKPFQPNVYVDITDFLPTKIEALRLHASQLRPSLYHGSPEALEMATRVRGREVSVEAAEGFQLLRGVL